MKTTLLLLFLILVSPAPGLSAQQESVVPTGVSDEGYDTRFRKYINEGGYNAETQEALIGGLWVEHGKQLIFFENWTLTCGYIAGQLHGDFVQTRDDGTVFYSVTYIEGDRQGPCYEDVLDSFGYIVDGQYRNDQQFGTWTNKDRDGNVINIFVFNEHGRMTYSSELQSDGTREWEWIIFDWQPYYFNYSSSWTKYVIISVSGFLVACVLVFRRRKRQLRLKDEAATCRQ